jgi:hypothetical protein
VDEQRSGVFSRRAAISAVAAAAVAVAADALVRPAPASAYTGVMQYGTLNDSGPEQTWLTSQSSDSTLLASNSGTGGGISSYSSGVASIAVYGNSNSGYGVIGDTALGAGGSPGIGVWGRDFNTTGQAGIAGASHHGAGVLGVAYDGAGYAFPAIPTGLTGVYGFSPTGNGVHGFSPTGNGVVAATTTGTALRVKGKAAFSRSGRATVAMGASHVDIDLTAIGGLAGNPLCFANILTRRPGVFVETVRPNDPAVGKLRIYLNKVASTRGATYVAWLVLN